MLFLLYILYNVLFKYIWSWISVTLIPCSHFLVPLKLQCCYFFPVDHLPLPFFVFPVSSIIEWVIMELLNQNYRWCGCCLSSYYGGGCSFSSIQDRCRNALRYLNSQGQKMPVMFLVPYSINIAFSIFQPSNAIPVYWFCSL
jgi:hypothetical protein